VSVAQWVAHLTSSWLMCQIISHVKGATGLYKPVGGTGSSFCMILNSMLHITDPFFTKLRNNFK